MNKIDLDLLIVTETWLAHRITYDNLDLSIAQLPNSSSQGVCVRWPEGQKLLAPLPLRLDRELDHGQSSAPQRHQPTSRDRPLQ